MLNFELHDELPALHDRYTSYVVCKVLNSELHDELPALHDSRILFLVTNMQTLFAAEEVFHSETAKVKQFKQTVSRDFWSLLFSSSIENSKTNIFANCSLRNAKILLSTERKTLYVNCLFLLGVQ